MQMRRKLGAHLELWRPYTSFYAGLLALASASLWQRGLPRLSVAWLIFTVPTMGWLAGLYCCDYFDRNLDKIQKAHRPIPSGRISSWEALIGMIICIVLGFAGSIRLGYINLLLAVGVLLAGFAYTVTKRWGILGNLNRGIPSLLTVLFGVAAVGGRGVPAGWIVPLLFFLHDVTTNLVGTIRDVEGDRAGKCGTVPVRHGLKVVIGVSIGLTLIWESLAAGMPFFMSLQWMSYYVFYIPALILATFGLLLVVWKSEQRRFALLAHKCFVAERLLLTGTLLAGGVNVWVASIVMLPPLLFTQWSQARLRDRYEFPLVVKA